jgi:hypothetical protein
METNFILEADVCIPENQLLSHEKNLLELVFDGTQEVGKQLLRPTNLTEIRSNASEHMSLARLKVIR